MEHNSAFKRWIPRVAGFALVFLQGCGPFGGSGAPAPVSSTASVQAPQGQQIPQINAQKKGIQYDYHDYVPELLRGLVALNNDPLNAVMDAEGRRKVPRISIYASEGHDGHYLAHPVQPNIWVRDTGLLGVGTNYVLHYSAERQNDPNKIEEETPVDNYWSLFECELPNPFEENETYDICPGNALFNPDGEGMECRLLWQAKGDYKWQHPPKQAVWKNNNEQLRNIRIDYQEVPFDEIAPSDGLAYSLAQEALQFGWYFEAAFPFESKQGFAGLPKDDVDNGVQRNLQRAPSQQMPPMNSIKNLGSGSLRFPQPAGEDSQASKRTIQNQDAMQRQSSGQSFVHSANSNLNRVSGSGLYRRASGSGMSTVYRNSNQLLRQSSHRRSNRCGKHRRHRCYKKKKTVLYDFGKGEKLVLERRGEPVTNSDFYRDNLRRGPIKHSKHYVRHHRRSGDMSSIKRSQSTTERQGHLLNRVVGSNSLKVSGWKSKNTTLPHIPASNMSPESPQDSFASANQDEDSFRTASALREKTPSKRSSSYVVQSNQSGSNQSKSKSKFPSKVKSKSKTQAPAMTSAQASQTGLHQIPSGSDEQVPFSGSNGSNVSRDDDDYDGEDDGSDVASMNSGNAGNPAVIQQDPVFVPNPPVVQPPQQKPVKFVRRPGMTSAKPSNTETEYGGMGIRQNGPAWNNNRPLPQQQQVNDAQQQQQQFQHVPAFIEA